MLRYIERATRSPLEPMDLPTIADVNEQRVARFRQRITEALAAGQAEAFRSLVEEYEREHNVPAIDIAAALAGLLQGGSPLLLKEKDRDRATAAQAGEQPDESGSRAPKRRERKQHDADTAAAPAGRLAEEDTETFRIEVGYVHGVKPGNIVGAIANVAGLEGRQIGHVDIREDHTFVGLPKGMPGAVMLELKKTRVAGQFLAISPVAHVPPKPLRKPPKRPAARPRNRP
jgi:ATP-dependent RNA helicase DeaD